MGHLPSKYPKYKYDLLNLFKLVGHELIKMFETELDIPLCKYTVKPTKAQFRSIDILYYTVSYVLNRDSISLISFFTADNHDEHSG